MDKRILPLLIAMGVFGSAGTATATATAPASRDAGASRELQLVTDDTSVRAPRSVRAGSVSVTLVNRGHQTHIGSLLRLSDGKTLADFRAVLRHPPAAEPGWIHKVPFGSFAPISPGLRVGITANLTATGTYVYYCLLTTPSGRQHALAGELASFRVIPPRPAGREVDADAIWVATDHAFTLPVLAPGRHVVRVLNRGTAPHEFAILQLNPGKALQDANAWLQSGERGPAPATFYGGVQSVEPGGSAVLHIRLESGKYLVGDGETGVFSHLTVRSG